jgi:2-oxoglutarate ferredoxin oxidoreductase subunit beta
MIQKTIDLTAQDFASDQDVRWCPGCGDYAILKTVQKLLPELGIPREQYVFVSGIGCSSRFPYYMNTYGFHTLHGRALAVASGIALQRPDLSVWVATGDGDSLSIGTNHLIHALRRNFDLKIMLFNNRIYGLTKGQYSPTSEVGKITPSTPMGSVDSPLNPITVALAAEATFVARTLDRDLQHLHQTLKQAAAHKGSAFVEIYQNCNIFNDGAFTLYTDRTSKPISTVRLEHGKPLVFGADSEMAIRLKGLKLESVPLKNDDPAKRDDILVHNAHLEDSTLALMLSRMGSTDGLPIPIGVFRQVQRPTYEETANAQIEQARAKSPSIELDTILSAGETWEVG